MRTNVEPRFHTGQAVAVSVDNVATGTTDRKNKNDATIFDRGAALQRLGDSEELLGEVAQIFLEQGPKLVNAMRDAAATNNFEELEAAAHTLKGSASVLAGSEVAGLAQQAEIHARQKHLPRVVEAFDELDRAMQDFETALRNSIAMPEPNYHTTDPVHSC